MPISYKKNILYNSIYRIVVLLTPLITSPYIARVLGAENIGIYTYCYVFALYFSIFAMLGTNDYGNRSIAKARLNENSLSECFWSIYYLQFFLAILTTGAYLVSIIFFCSDYQTIRLLLLAYVATSFFDINWFAFGMEEFKFTSIRNVVVRLSIVFCIFIFVRTEDDLPAYAAVLAFGNLLSTLPIWFLLKGKVKFKKINIASIKQHVKPNVILFLPVVATMIYMHIDKLMLGNASMQSEVGFFQNAENIVTLPSFLTIAIATVMLPHISNMISNGECVDANRLMKNSLYYSTILNIGMAFGLFAVANVFIPWFLGGAFERSAELVQMMSPIIIVGGVSNIVRYEYLIPNEKDKILTSSIILGAIVNVALNFFLIPIYKANGAAIATVVAYLFVMVYQMFFTHKEINYANLLLKLTPYIVLGFFMCYAITVVNTFLHMRNAFVFLIDFFVGVFVYVVGALFIMLITKDNVLNNLKKMRRKVG